MANNKTEMSNYITLIKNNGSGAGMVGDGGDRLVIVGSGMVGFAHDADGDHERCNGEREGEMARHRWEGEVASMIMGEEGGKLYEKGRKRV